ncbi:MAG: pantetheine-phosphate adenylyltransferase [Abditibacteriota bacterium]|nr:pantetheine-phosphate adenylyltransferase [Abditibacteriota bacterium]
MVAVYPGSFDPITCGHLDIIERAARIFDEVIILCAVNPSKRSMFSIEEKQALIREATEHLPNVRVDYFTGLLVDYMRAHGVKVAIKGLRVISDFEYELQMALMNKRLAEDVETFFMMTRSEHLFLSSSMVKELAGFDSPLDALVPPCVVEPLKEKINSKR